MLCHTLFLFYFYNINSQQIWNYICFFNRHIYYFEIFRSHLFMYYSYRYIVIQISSKYIIINEYHPRVNRITISVHSTIIHWAFYFRNENFYKSTNLHDNSTIIKKKTNKKVMLRHSVGSLVIRGRFSNSIYFGNVNYLCHNFETTNL